MTNDQVLDAGMAKVREIADAAIVVSLSELAEKSINRQLRFAAFGGHDEGTYENDTFNLHDSYGYAIYRNGAIRKKWMNDSKATEADSGGTKGSTLGSTFLDNFSSTGSWQLVVVAGEFYADELQNTYKFDVLLRAYQDTQEDFLKDFKRIMN